MKIAIQTFFTLAIPAAFAGGLPVAVSIPTFVQSYGKPERPHDHPRAAPFPYASADEALFRGLAFALLFELACALLVYGALRLF
jgi:hypothetical protein